MKTGKNIALLVETTFPPVSRANLRLYRLARVLVKQGHKATMVTPSMMPSDRKTTTVDGIVSKQYWGFCQYLYARVRALVRLYHLVAAIWSVVLLNSEESIDIIHAWNPLAGLAGILAGKIIKKPVFLDFTDFYSDIAVDDSPFMIKALQAVERFCLNNAKKIMVVSEVMVDRLSEMGIPKEKILVVPDGTDSDIFNDKVCGKDIRKKLKIPAKSPVIIFHGDIKPPDGVDILFEAFKKVLEELNDAKLLVLGGGGKYFEDLKELGEKRGIDQSIIYTGWVPHADVPRYIAAADVGAMTLRATLNHHCYLSFKLFEYWGCGKPAVITRLKALSQIIENGKQAIIVEPEDIDGYADAFIELLSNRPKAREMGREGRKLVEEVYSWDKIMEKEANLYEETI